MSINKNYKAWVAKAAKQPMVLETVDPGPLGAEDVEIAVEYCGLCHSDISVLNNDWGILRYPVILGHKVIGRVTTPGPNAKGLKAGQRVGIGWNAGSCMHCHECMSGIHHLCAEVQPTIVGHRGGFASHVRSHWAFAIPFPEQLKFAEAGRCCAGAPPSSRRWPCMPNRPAWLGSSASAAWATCGEVRRGLRPRCDGLHLKREQV